MAKDKKLVAYTTLGHGKMKVKPVYDTQHIQSPSLPFILYNSLGLYE